MISSTPKSNFKRYQRLKQTESAKSTSTPIVAKGKANVLLSPVLQKKNAHHHHHQLSLSTSPKCIGSSRSTINGGIVLSTPSPSLMIRCISSSTATATSPKNAAACGVGGPVASSSSAAAIHAFRMSATPSPLAIRIRQQILKGNEKAPTATPTSVSPKKSAFFTSSSRPGCASGNTPRASLVSPSITQKSFNDKNRQSAPGRTCLQTTKGFSASAAASFQSPTLKMNSSIIAAETTRPPSTFAKKNHFISPSSSSLQENSFHNRHQNNNGSTGTFISSPNTPLQQATTTASSTKPLSISTTKTNIQASSQTSITKMDVVRKQDSNVGNKAIVAPPRSWSHEELMDWLAKHELLDNNNNDKSSKIPCHVNGQMVMRMSKAQLLNCFYDGDCIVNKKKTETLFRRLRLESDRADRLLLKKRVAGTKCVSSIGK